MYKKILVPLDGSKRAAAILPHVEQMALRYKAGVIFLEVVQPFLVISGPEAAYEKLYEKEYQHQQELAENYLTGVEDEFRKKGIETRKHITQGPVVENIIEVANKESADLIAIASHGRTGLSRVFYGSVASGLLHRIDRPLLLIRSRDYS